MDDQARHGNFTSAHSPDTGEQIRLVNLAFITFLFIALLAPWSSLYKAVFYLFVVPAVLLQIYRHDSRLLIADRFILLASLLVVYVALSNFFVSDAGMPENLKQLRWSAETLILISGVYMVTRHWLARPRLYGRLLFAAILIASVVTLASYLASAEYGERLSGFGFLEVSTLGAAVLAVFWAMGVTLLQMESAPKAGDYALGMLTLLVIFTVCLLTMSRGPTLSLVIYILLTILLVACLSKENRKPVCLIGFSTFVLLLCIVAFLNQMFPVLDNMLDRGASLRPDIWLATLRHPPESILFGEGYATRFIDTAAGQTASELAGIEIWHPHNLALSAYYFSGIIGLLLLIFLILLLLRRILRHQADIRRKVLMLGLFALVLMLNTTSGHVIVISPDPVWVLFWVPLVFLAAITRPATRADGNRQHPPSDNRPGNGHCASMRPKAKAAPGLTQG